MRFDILTLFPGMYQGFLEESLMKKALDKGLIDIKLHDFREYSTNKHQNVDDTPYGGGAGMLLMCQPIFDCVDSIKNEKSHIILFSPQGKTFKQEDAIRLSKMENIIMICGHYEGFDERIRTLADEELSLGDFVLTGGELPSMVVMDSVCRMINGFIEEDSHEFDSFSHWMLEHPQYTKPRVYRDMEVPFVLTNGDHAKIDAWRIKESLRRTYLKRPDLLENHILTKEERKYLDEIILEESEKN